MPFPSDKNTAAVLKPHSPRHWLALPQDFRDKAARSINTVLLETSRYDATNHTSYLFSKPTRFILAHRLEDIPTLFQQLETALNQGLWVAGYLSYECGYHFEKFEGVTLPRPLAWFGIYSEVEIFDHFQAIQASEQPIAPQKKESSARHEPIAPSAALQISKACYIAAIAKIKEHLAAGDTYQVNFTDRLALTSSLSAVELFAALSAQQRVAYSALLNIEGASIISLSPELFFRIDGDRISTRPMKGTMPRGLDAQDDDRVANLLRNDAKNRSEHVMIVDLLRNDLGRICRAGSIQVETPFSIERYETLHQMTSSVIGRLDPGISFYDIFRALFPSASITGAPKHRSMQIIRQLERQPRGVYSGAIGFINPNRSSVFNVAIRTLIMREGHVTMGVGGGIVADSDADDEYRECLLKASFVTNRHEPFQLIETLLWDGEVALLDLHLDRLESSALYFDFPFDRSHIRADLEHLTKCSVFRGRTPHRIRLTLAADGRLAKEISQISNQDSEIKIWLTDERTCSSDAFLRHKTTRRHQYDRLYETARNGGFDEVIFTNERGEITEGAISNIFIEKEGKLFTPPLASGVLPGVRRRHILETCTGSEEAVLTLRDLKAADGIYLCNALRGLRRVISFSTAPLG